VKVVVVALGKVGLPLATAFAARGHDVVGADIDERVVAAVNAGRAPFPNEPGLEEQLATTPVRATTDTAAAVAQGPELVVAVVPLLVDDAGTPQWEALDAATRAIGAGLQRGTTVALETTVPVGTTRSRFAATLAQASGLRATDDFAVGFSPERISSGSALRDLATYPKIVGGLTPADEDRIAELYEAGLGVEVRRLGSAEAAELSKLVETTYRDVNIALANEFARHADTLGIDIGPVIAAANSQPYSHVHRPGVAVGGHCMPVYPRFYLAGDADARLPGVARDVNEAMPAYAVELLRRQLGGDLTNARVLILGVAYRGGVKETAFSGARPLRDALTQAGATVVASDPLYSDDDLRALGFTPADGAPADGAIVQADHAEYRTLTPHDLPGVRAIVDGRGILDRSAFAAAGVAITGIGTP
jgi:UDP-N-acetyl-D-glucosamine dehydrogenase